MVGVVIRPCIQTSCMMTPFYNYIILEECNVLLTRYAIYTHVTTGTNFCALIAKLEIMVWHCPGNIYIIIYNYITEYCYSILYVEMDKASSP